MKLGPTFMMMLALGFSCVSFAAEPLSADGKVLGINEGRYQGHGQLKFQSGPLSSVDFDSQRELRDGKIIATTTAKLLGIPVATAHAELQVVPTQNGEFKLLDLTNNAAECGGGSCDSDSCTFTATVMGGKLTLHETWQDTLEGFRTIRSSQVFNGTPATYTAVFVHQP